MTGFLSLPLRWGRLVIKWNGLCLFSEREKLVPSWSWGPLRITWRAKH